MKGYTKVTISKEEAEAIGELISPAIEYCENYIVSRKETGFWIFKCIEYTYRSDKPPFGASISDPAFGRCATKKKWVYYLSDILQLAEAGQDIYLNEELASTLNNFRLGKYKK